MEPEIVVDYADHLGENPLWHPIRTAFLYRRTLP